MADDKEAKDPIDILIGDLEEGIQKNGSLSAKDRGELQLKALKVLLELIHPMPRQIEELQHKNIILWIEKHPKITPTVITLLVLTVMFLHELSPVIMTTLGALVGIKIP